MAYSAKGRTKNFPVFDCDSHIYEPPEIWDKYIPQKNRDFAKTHFYRDADRLFLVRNRENQFQRSRQVEISRRDLASGSDQENHRRRRSREPKSGMKPSAETKAPEIPTRG